MTEVMGSHGSNGVRQRRLRIAKRILGWVFLLAISVLLVLYARRVDWQEVAAVMAAYDGRTLALAVALATVSYLFYGGYDLLGRAYSGHRLSWRQVMAVAFICYAFTMSLSAWVGGIGMRYRLYSRLGLDSGTITRIFSLSIVTNWLGYVLLAGALFSAGVVRVPHSWAIGETALRVLGAVLLLAVIAYLLLCALARKREWLVRGRSLVLPSLPLAVSQLLLSSLNWMAMGAILYLFLPASVAYPVVLGVLLISSIAGVVTHIPAGIGVLEAVFVMLLTGEDLSRGTILGAVLAYRALYYLAPLLLALVSYVMLESHARKLRRANERKLAQSSS